MSDKPTDIENDDPHEVPSGSSDTASTTSQDPHRVPSLLTDTGSSTSQDPLRVPSLLTDNALSELGDGVQPGPGMGSTDGAPNQDLNQAPMFPDDGQSRPLGWWNVGPKKITKWRVLGGVLTALLVGAAIAGSVVRLPYYSFRPGTVYGTVERVEAPTDLIFLPDGSINFVTVSQTANITPWEWLDAKLDRSVRIAHADEVEGDQTRQERREADLRRMQVSKESAVVLALERLGYELVVTPLGIEVAQVFDCTAADGTLGTGDLIVGVNGIEVRTNDELVAELIAVGIGEDVELSVERIDPSNPTQSLRTDTVGLTLGSADASCLADDVRAEEPRPFIGISTLPITDEEFPIDINVDTGTVGGPSAGLAITLGVMDLLSAGELTGGLKIVATGTIDREGNVGPVGGISQKVVAAERAGADLFIVPACCDNFVSSRTGDPIDLDSNVDEAIAVGADVRVVGVDTLDEALEAIAEIGGDVSAFVDAGATDS